MIRHFTTLSLLALLASCTSQNAPALKPAFDSSRNPDLLAPDLYPNGAISEKEPVVRYGRYTLVSTLPESGQRDLMAQIIDVNIPANMKPDVRDAMQYVMDRSGFSLCAATSGHVNILYTRPLPAAQFKLGPMTLRNTLQVLAGPAWQVKVDEVNRQVCYVLRPGYELPDAPSPASTLVATQPAVAKPLPPVKEAVAIAAVPTVPGIVTSPAVSPPAVPTQKVPLPQGALTVARPVPADTARAAGPAAGTTRWTAPVGSTLHKTITDWCKQAGWQLVWSQEDLDYPIEAPLSFNGSFQEAIAQIFPLYDHAPRRFAVDGNPVQRMVYVSERAR